ncbi:hypothetical protein MHYP_G00206540 [Metynnis hypsauchen]
MEDTSRNRASMEDLALKRENLQLKDRLSRLEMEMQEEREAWKVEKREILRRNRASDHLALETENLQLKHILSWLEMICLAHSRPPVGDILGVSFVVPE